MKDHTDAEKATLTTELLEATAEQRPLSASEKCILGLARLLLVPEVLRVLNDGHDETFCACSLCYARIGIDEYWEYRGGK
jgi:hypothetical protein